MSATAERREVMNERHSQQTEGIAASVNVRQILVDRVTIGERLRCLSAADVEQLADSMRELGLLQPIAVKQADGGYRLVAGRHRLEAAKVLGWRTIPAIVLDLDEVDQRLAEIDENLSRHHLTAVERARHLAERKRLYLLKHPETRRGTAGGRARQGAANEMISFARDTALRIGRSERSVQQDTKVGEGIPGDVMSAVLTSAIADSKTDLMAFERLPEAAQHEIVEHVNLGNRAELRAAIAERRSMNGPRNHDDESVNGDVAAAVGHAEQGLGRLALPEQSRPGSAARRRRAGRDGAQPMNVEPAVEAFVRAVESTFSPDERRELIRRIQSGLDDDVPHDAPMGPDPDATQGEETAPPGDAALTSHLRDVGRRPHRARSSEAGPAPAPTSGSSQEPIERFAGVLDEHGLHLGDEQTERALTRDQARQILQALQRGLADSKWHAAEDLAAYNAIGPLMDGFLVAAALATGSRSKVDATLVKNGKLAIVDFAATALRCERKPRPGRRGPWLRRPRSPEAAAVWKQTLP
jgi:ParB family chromosome partitioning protein